MAKSIDNDVINETNYWTGVLVVVLISMCIISSAINGIVQSCAPTREERCVQTCGTQGVRVVNNYECKCK